MSDSQNRPERRMGDSLAVLLATAVISLSVGLGAWVLESDRGEESPAAPAATVIATDQAASSPLIRDPQALMLARSSSAVLVGVAAVPGGPVDLVVFENDERALASGSVRVSLNGQPARRLTPGVCGEGCVRVDAVALAGSPLRLTVDVERPGEPTESVRLRLPALLPPSGEALLERAKRTMLALRTLRVEETLSAGGRPVRSSWEIQAPDRLSVTASDGGSTVLIGKTRWDLIDGSWQESSWDGARQPWYAWETARNARVLGTARIAGERVTRLAVFTPDPEPWWFTLWVADDGRVLKVEMLAPSHFMVDVFSGFDKPVSIEAPA